MSGELVYLVYPDGEIVDRVSRSLHQSGYKVLTMKSEGEAEEVIANFKYVLPDVLLTPLDDPTSDDSILFKLLTANPLMEQVPVVIFASGDQEQRRAALRRGLTNLVFPPYDPEEVILTTRLALDRHRDENRLFGSLAQLGVPDLLQTVEVGRRSGALTLRHRGTKGTIWFRNGVIVDGAIDDGRAGEDAVYAMAVWSEGTFEADFNPVAVAERISLSPSVLLLDAMRRLDEEERDRAIASGEYPALADEDLGELEDEPDPAAVRPGGAIAPPPAAAPPAPPEPEPPRAPANDAITVHLALTLLNIAAAHARGFLTPQLLHRRLEAEREQLEHAHPALRMFQVTPDGLVVIAPDVTVVLQPQEVVGATSRWLSAFFGAMERSMPGRFTLKRFAQLTAGLSGSMREEGFLAALDLDDLAGSAP